MTHANCIRSIALCLIGSAFGMAQVATPPIGIARFSDASVRNIYGLPQNLVVDSNSFGSFDATSFSDQFGLVAANGQIQLVKPDFTVIGEYDSAESRVLANVDAGASSIFWFYELHHWGLPTALALILALLTGGLVGAINGAFVAVIGISSFVATLGMLFVLDGITLVMSHATPVSMPDTSSTAVGGFAQVFGGGTYSELIWALAIVVILQLVLSVTRWGIYTVAVGGNRLGSAEAGISVPLVLIRNFVMCAMLAGFVGVLEATRTTTATPDPSASNDILFQAISAAVIGGTLLRGGAGTVLGALIGALFLGILHDGLILRGVNANYVDLYLGLAILIAMTANLFVSRVRTGSGRG
jgi:simple sugar transport system permease protein